MNNFIPMMITIYLENGFCKLSNMPFDSILAKLHFQQEMNDETFDGDYYKQLPFLKMSDGIYHTSKPFYEISHISNETIMGIECNGYYISGLEPKSGQIATLTYFYPKDKEYINPSFYKNYNDFFYNKVIEKMKSPFYKLIMDMGKYTVTFTIENIGNKIIQEDKFNLPSNIPIQN